MLNSVCLVYIGIINRSYINNYYCKDYIYKQKKLKLFVCKKERKIIFFLELQKEKKPYYFKLLGNLTQLIKKNQKTIVFIWQHVPFYSSTCLQQRIMQY